MLRALRQARRELRASKCGAEVEAALDKAQSAVRALDIPHMGPEDEDEDLVVH